MSKLSEEETINRINDLLEFMEEEFKAKHSIFRKIEYQAVKTLLDLYEQEKEVNDINLTIVYMNGYYDGEDKWKKKLKEKIKEYDGLKEMDMQAYEEQVEPLKEMLEEE